MNKVILIGNVGNSPNVKTLDSGASVASFSFATSERYKNQQGEKVELTEWHNLEAWNALVKVCQTIIQKGDRLCIEGRIKTEKWDDGTGINRSRTKIVVQRIELLGKKREQVEKEYPKQENATNKKAKKSKVTFEADPETDLPF